MVPLAIGRRRTRCFPAFELRPRRFRYRRQRHLLQTAAGHTAYPCTTANSACVLRRRKANSTMIQ